MAKKREKKSRDSQPSEDQPLFYAPLIPSSLTLPNEESRHLYRVLRLREGATIRVTDGRGSLYSATVTYPDPESSEIILNEELPSVPISQASFHLAIAPTKNIDRIEWLLEKLTECGILHFHLVITERTIRNRVNTERLERILVSAMKQSLRSHLPSLTLHDSLAAFLDTDLPPQRFIGYCADHIAKQDIHPLYRPNLSTTVLIGPEGDFTEEEVRLCLKHDFTPVSLDPSRLRTETAGLYVGMLHLFSNPLLP